MRLFYGLLLFLLAWTGLVLVYDLFQADIEQQVPPSGIIFHPASGRFTYECHTDTVMIVYASMFGPGEPIMRVRDPLMDAFEIDYGNRLSLEYGTRRTDMETDVLRAECALKLRKMAGPAANLYRKITEAGSGAALETATQGALEWLTGHHVTIPDDVQVTAVLAGIKDFSRDRQALNRIDIVSRVAVKVERRWQGRWVLSANRPRFLTGREVPDIIVGSKMELLALVEDDYVIALNRPLPGSDTAPLDTFDAYGDPRRTWREAFMPAMLEEGKYNFISDVDRRDNIYIAPLWCNTNCIFYNKVLFRKAGIAIPPRTWPEFLEACAQLQAAGIAPLTADQGVYADMWRDWLMFRVVGQDTWENTITGMPRDVLPLDRTSVPAWTDPLYTEVFSAIRTLRDNGYFRDGFQGLTWPAAQRGFAAGDAAMMICGSWLVQELGGYKDIETAGIFELGCFSFPAWPETPFSNSRAAMVSVYGLAVCRQGRAAAHAIELIKYLSARDHEDMVYRNAQISCMVDADFPPDLEGISRDFRTAPVVWNRVPSIYARRFNAAVLQPLYEEFFLQSKDDGMSVEAFQARLQEANTAYLKAGGEEGFE